LITASKGREGPRGKDREREVEGKGKIREWKWVG